MAAQGRSRTLWLGAALLATLLAAQWVSGEDGRADTVQPDEETGPRKETRAPETRAPETEMTNAAEQLELELELERLERRKFSAQAGDIFRQQSWAPPPPSPSSLKPPPPPPPPPLQFKYLGKVTAGDETQVFLALAERNYIVKPGDTVNSQYRMDEVNDHSITFTYLPLNATQTLATAQAGDIP
ncbi:MAG: secretion system X translation initiation factor [Nitrosospira sp.]|nr:secretion system X translation initiation factor [Nitrosospira sp.]